jgi:hypothetical protein
MEVASNYQNVAFQLIRAIVDARVLVPEVQCIYVDMYVHTYLHTFMYVYMYICINLYKYIA